MTRRGRGDDGFVAGGEAVVFGVLVFAIGVLVVANAWGVVDAKLAASAAAREATRAFVESEATTTDAAFAEAHDAAAAAIEGHGRQVERFALRRPADLALTRCAVVALEATYEVPLVSLPLVGRFGDGFTVVGRHREVVDPYRSGVPGRRTACP